MLYLHVAYASLRIRSSEIEALKDADSSLYSTFKAARQMVASENIELILRVGKEDRLSENNTLIQVVREVLKREDLKAIASHFEVKGEDMETRRVATLDLLSSQLLTHRSILKQSDKGRSVNPDSAFAQIAGAYQQKLEEIKEAFSISE